MGFSQCCMDKCGVENQKESEAVKPAKSILDGPFVAFDHYDSFGVDFNPWPLYREWMPTQWPAPNYRSKITPEVGILNSSFKYTPSTHTDVRETWKRHGWKPKESAPQAAESARTGAVHQAAPSPAEAE